jgi:putative restriction endonuclease
MNANDLLERIANINVCSSGDRRSPHKPLLLLLSLGRFQSGKPRLTGFDELEDRLVKLLEDFGPASARKTPHLPFWHLQSDGIWEIPHREGVLTASGSVGRKFLRDCSVQGGFTPEVFQLLKADTTLVEKIAFLLLDIHFPSSVHQDIIDEVGLDLEAGSEFIPHVKRPKRDPGFRRRILEAYDYRCAICDMSIRMENTPIALEAAHIKWFQVGGPDIETNGLALCSLHHKLLDRGAIAISEESRIVVSPKANGHTGFQEWVMRFEGEKIRLPRNKNYAPNPEFTQWHIREIYQGDYVL